MKKYRWDILGIGIFNAIPVIIAATSETHYPWYAKIAVTGCLIVAVVYSFGFGFMGYKK